MTASLHALALICFGAGAVLFVFGAVKLIFVPMALVFEVRDHQRRRLRLHTDSLLVSVVVPAYNEGRTLTACVRSILASDHSNVEVVVVDDGSTDDTSVIMAGLAAEDPRLTAIGQDNAGKGAALNAGISASRGSVLMFVDADGIFTPSTVCEMLRALEDPRVGAVCGDDRAVNLDRTLTRTLAVLSHIGTGLVRRALSLARCLPIVSGNIGAFPRHVIDRVGGFNETTVGEDLELTWRVAKAGYRVTFAPRALVYAEVPSRLPDLWRQRVRWCRGLLQTMRLHADAIGNPRYGAFGGYLVINTLTMLVMPILQLVALLLLPFAFMAQTSPVSPDVLSVLGWLGLLVALLLVIYAIGLNGEWRDLRLLWTLLGWPLYSIMMSAVVVVALTREARRQPAPWNKMQRTGVVTRTAVSQRVYDGSGTRMVGRYLRSVVAVRSRLALPQRHRGRHLGPVPQKGQEGRRRSVARQRGRAAGLHGEARHRRGRRFPAQVQHEIHGHGACGADGTVAPMADRSG